MYNSEKECTCINNVYRFYEGGQYYYRREIYLQGLSDAGRHFYAYTCHGLNNRLRFLHARQESFDLEKKELDLVVLATLRASCSLPNDPSSQLTITPLGSREVQFFQSFFKPIPGITTYHHFKVSKAEPGIVAVKEYANSPEVKIEIFNQCSFSSGTTTK